VEQQYSREQAVVFLEESGIDLDRIRAPPDVQPQGVADVLIALERWAGSDGRRVLRRFLGRWLSNQLHTGPSDELRRSLLAQLARQGWQVRDGSLVTGDPHATGQAPGIVPESLHPWVWDAAGKLWDSGHRRPAVQAAATAINERLQDKLGRHDLADDKLLQEAFSTIPPEPGKPRLRIHGDLRNPTVASRQRGAPQFGVGCFWVIRNPATHVTSEWPPQEGLEQLAALSVLARLIDMCEVATHEAATPGRTGALRIAAATRAAQVPESRPTMEQPLSLLAIGEGARGDRSLPVHRVCGHGPRGI
ncbi:MAG: TIGR02391 family protein, partial [Trebonia sp.]